MAGYRKDAIFVRLLLFHIAVYPIMLNPNTKGSTRRARNTQARDLASPPKKATKEPKHERQHPTSKKHPSEGFGIAPKKGKKNKKKHERQHPTSKKHPSEGFGIAPKKGKKQKKHERQHPTSKKHPSEGFGIAPKKGKAALG